MKPKGQISNGSPTGAEVKDKDDLADRTLQELSREELIELIETQRSDVGVRISFSGKNDAGRLARLVQPRSARKVMNLCIGPELDQARNQVIEGENLQAMVTLYREKGHVDLIITDPPYNTGSDFRYNDRWEEDPNDSNLGEFVTEDEAGRRTKWMRFMLPRLRMMKAMLKPGGVLAICIDHRELFRLGQMLDELFDERNRLAIINWQRSYSPRNDQQHVSTATEYVLVYARNEELAKTQLLARTEAMDARYRSPDGDPKPWKPSDAGGPGAATHQGMVYGVQSPFTGVIHYPPPGSCWRSDKRDMKTWLAQWGTDYVEKPLNDQAALAKVIGCKPDDAPRNKALVLAEDVAKSSKRARAVLAAGTWPQLLFGRDGTGKPSLKRHLENIKQGRVPTTFWSDEDFDNALHLGTVSWGHEESGHSQTGIRELDAIVGRGHGFETVKPLKLFSKIIQLWCPSHGLVLDPFAGSGTTGHAVLQLNAQAGTQRRFILIEQGRPERGDTYARSLTAQRIKRAVTGNWAAGKMAPTGGGFRFLALQNKVDAKALLAMERDEMTDAVIASHFDSSRGGGPGLITMTHDGYEFLVARNTDDEGFYLVWRGAHAQPVFDKAVYETIVAEAKRAKLKPRYHVYARFNLYQSDDVAFYQIPNRILMDFGLSVAADAFNNESADALSG